ncbi:hypothetical protein D3C78_1632820 [compost metagenome]
MAARHALDAVFAARERRAQRDEVDQLRAGQRDHRERDARAPDGQQTGDRAYRGRDQQAKQHAQRRV